MVLSPRQMDSLLAEARRNEEIQARLDSVEEFLLERQTTAGLFERLCPFVGKVYGLQDVTLTLNNANQALANTIETSGTGILSPHCHLRDRREMRLLLADLDRPYLSDRPGKQVLTCFFPDRPSIKSLAIVPLWPRGDFLGCLNLGSDQPDRFRPQYGTHFLARLGRKVAAGLFTGLVAERASVFERSQAAIEMAGAACHELAQPVTNLALMMEMQLHALPEDSPYREGLAKMAREVETLGDLIKKISKVSRYVTKPYVQGMRIIDLDQACTNEER